MYVGGDIRYQSMMVTPVCGRAAQKHGYHVGGVENAGYDGHVDDMNNMYAGCNQKVSQ